MTISTTTLALLKFSKSGTNDYSWKNIRDICLGELYHYDMRFHDVFQIVLKSVNEIINEPRFENHFAKDIINVLIRQEMEGRLFFDKPISEITGEEMMQRILTAIMFDAFRFARVDWCEEFKNYPNRFEIGEEYL